jgi:hypothetical protein
MDVFDAIKKMREMSERNKPFSFSFMSYSRDNHKSSGIIEVSRAVLRKQSTVEDNKFADIMLNYYNLDTNEYCRCYQLLLIELNGEKLELN